MEYNIKAHSTKYGNVVFRSRLEARWAAFFDLIGWEWEYEPIDLDGWSPDFRVTFSCGHSECKGCHSLLVEIKPYFTLKDFEGHPCLDYPFGCKYDNNGENPVEAIPADASAAFGSNPDITSWQMVHGCGGGVYNIEGWEGSFRNISKLWDDAGSKVQYKVKNHASKS